MKEKMEQSTVETIGSEQSGSHTGFQVEVKNIDGVWKGIYLRDFDLPIGNNPYILNLLGLVGFETAHAMAWTFMAKDLRGRLLEIRLVPYHIRYEIKSCRKEDKSLVIMWQEEQGDK